MKFAIIQFPGSNCDRDCFHALGALNGAEVEFVWHKAESLKGFDAVVLPGGFSYGDYLRAGAIARFSPVMHAVRSFAAEGGLVIGICNGFQILCESGLLPGALTRNTGLHFVCRDALVRVETSESPFTTGVPTGSVLRMPIAHGEGRYTATMQTLIELNAGRQILLRYSTAKARLDPAANPNGSIESIAGICNAARNVFGLMPHPERAADPLSGSTDGRHIFEAMIRWHSTHPAAHKALTPAAA